MEILTMQSTDRKIGGFCVDIGVYATVYVRALSVGVEVMLAKGRAWAAVTGLASWENRGLKRHQRPPFSAAIFPETCVVV
jgi:hypothetical protein